MPFLRSITSRDPLPRAVALSILVLYIIVVSAVAMHHEPWRDEADPWLTARDASASELWQFFHHGGTPGLWYFLLMPLARAGAPYGSEHVLHVLIASASAALILFASPFPRITRVLLPFSYYFGYEYAVVARSYALSVLLLFIVAALHPRRLERPIPYAIAVALLANTNVHALVVAAMIGLAYLLERGKPAATVIMLAGGMLAIAQAWPAPDAMVHGAISVFHPEAPTQAIRGAFFPMIIMPHWIAVVFGVAIIVASLFAVRSSRFALLVLLGSYTFFVYIFVFKWIGGLRYFGFVLLVLLFALWFAEARSVICWSLLSIAIAVSVASCAFTWSLDWRFAFSGAKEMAEFIRARGMQSYSIAAHSETTTSALGPYFDHPFWYAGIEKYGTFSKWDGAFERGLEVSYPEAAQRARGRFPLLLLNVEMPNPERNGWHLLYHNRRPQFANFDEAFWLYGALR